MSCEEQSAFNHSVKEKDAVRCECGINDECQVQMMFGLFLELLTVIRRRGTIKHNFMAFLALSDVE